MGKSVLFICVDQWRWDCFSFMKHKNALTPYIDKLVKESTAFTSHFSGIVPCGPARTTMLTGLYPFIHRSVTNGAPLDKRFTNIAKEVRKIGYEPKLYGYTDTSWDPRYLEPSDEKNFTYESPMEGFDPVCHLPSGNPVTWANYLNNNGFKVKDPKDLYQDRKPEKGIGFIHKPFEIPTEYSDSSFLTNELIRDLKKTDDTFFMHISFLKPHPPMYVSEPWHSLINPDDIDLPFMDKTIEEMSNQHPVFKEILKKYTNEDNFSEIRFSDLNDFTESVDISPTILDWLETEIPTDWNGQSLLPIIKNSPNKTSPKEYVIFDCDFRENHYTSFVKNKKLAPEECNLSVIRTKKWKYVHFPSLPPLLFNILDDPYETNNLAYEKDYLEIQNNLLSKLLSHRMLHQERQLSNGMLSKGGMKINSGPSNRKIEK